MELAANEDNLRYIEARILERQNEMTRLRLEIERLGAQAEKIRSDLVKAKIEIFCHKIHES